MKRVAAGAILLTMAGLLIGPAPAASAHTELILSTPDDGAQVATVPDDVVLTFSEDLIPDSVAVSVEDSAGMVVRVLELAVDGSDVIVTWPPGLSGNEYTVNYRVVSQDGHPVDGSVYFSVAAPPSSEPVATAETDPTVAASPIATDAVASPSTATESSGSTAALAAIAVGLAVGVVAGVVIVLVRRRGSAPSGGQS